MKSRKPLAAPWRWVVRRRDARGRLSLIELRRAVEEQRKAERLREREVGA